MGNCKVAEVAENVGDEVVLSTNMAGRRGGGINITGDNAEV